VELRKENWIDLAIIGNLWLARKQSKTHSQQKLLSNFNQSCKLISPGNSKATAMSLADSLGRASRVLFIALTEG